MHIRPQVEELFTSIKKPLTYIASEENAVFKKSAKLHFCLIYPDLYELGINSLGLNILYSVLNGEKDVWAQRVYMPDLDMLVLLKDSHKPLFSLEEQRPLKQFDVLGFSLPHELCYSNILHVLQAAHIEIRSQNRLETDPLIIAGGHGAYNPLPLAPFIDAFVIGEGEEVVLEIARKTKNQKPNIKNKEDQLYDLSNIEGVWVPSHQSPNTNHQSLIKKRVIKDINKVSYTPLVPVTKGENRLVAELMRGCTAGCRFCQAGFINRPLREKNAEIAFKEAVIGISQHGLSSLSLLSLNTSDYSQIGPLINNFTDELANKKVAISLPSLRVSNFSVAILEKIASVKKTGLTFAIEAGSQRLRGVINKQLSEEQIIDTLGKVFSSGWNKMKLYFMVGLPTETHKDLEELIRLLKEIEETARSNLERHLFRRLKIIVSVSNFVPKPHTPFQWAAQDSLKKLHSKHRFLIKKVKGPVFKLRWHNAEQSAIEGLLARGDYKTADVLEKAFERGAQFDNFSERFDFTIWQEAMEKVDVKLDDYLKGRSLSEELPWRFINCGVSNDFLKSEFDKGIRSIQTENCRFGKCPKCGLCDKEVKNCFSSDFKALGALPSCHPSAVTVKYRLFLKKEGFLKYLSHLEWIAWVQRRLRKANIELVMRGGYNPRPKLSFSAALPVGVSSKKTFVDFEVLSSYPKKELEKKLKESFSETFIDCILKGTL